MTAKELEDKYYSDLKALQENCKHEDVSDWLLFEYIPMHGDGECKQCNICCKIMERRNSISNLNHYSLTELSYLSYHFVANYQPNKGE